MKNNSKNPFLDPGSSAAEVCSSLHQCKHAVDSAEGQEEVIVKKANLKYILPDSMPVEVDASEM